LRLSCGGCEPSSNNGRSGPKPATQRFATAMADGMKHPQGWQGGLEAGCQAIPCFAWPWVSLSTHYQSIQKGQSGRPLTEMEKPGFGMLPCMHTVTGTFSRRCPPPMCQIPGSWKGISPAERQSQEAPTFQGPGALVEQVEPMTVDGHFGANMEGAA
jgi:hypothetical protein